MAGTDISDKADGLVAHDHTYFGNGCPGDDSQPESYESCSSKTEPTFDGETQNIGSYYNFQAATASSGVVLSEANTIAPDTFCPLGWQMPYSGTGGDYYDKSRSMKYLFETYGLLDDQHSAEEYLSYPFSNTRSGRIRFDVAGLRFVGTAGFFHPVTVAGGGNMYRIEVWRTNLRYNGPVPMIFGYTVRCNSKVSILILKHN